MLSSGRRLSDNELTLQHPALTLRVESLEAEVSIRLTNRANFPNALRADL
jgi:hypothetical protein